MKIWKFPNTLDFKVIVSLFILLFISQGVLAKFRDLSIEDAFDSAELVAKIKVKESTPHYWKHPRGKRICGYTLKIEILRNYKGNEKENISVGSQDGRYIEENILAFLFRDEGDFASDVIIKYDSEHQLSKEQCLKKMPLLKISPLLTSTYSSSGEYVFPSYLLTFPNKLPINILEVKKVFLNNKVEEVTSLPFDVLMKLPIGGRTNIRYINTKYLEEWFEKQKN